MSKYENRATMSLLNMCNEMFKKDIEIRRITKTCALLLMSGLSPHDIQKNLSINALYPKKMMVDLLVIQTPYGILNFWNSILNMRANAIEQYNGLYQITAMRKALEETNEICTESLSLGLHCIYFQRSQPRKIWNGLSKLGVQS